MATSVSSVTSHFPSAENGFTTTTSGSVASGATTVGLNSVAGYTNGEVVVFVIDPTDSNKKQTFTGIMDTVGSQVTDVVWTAGTNQTHDLGATVVDYATATHISMMSKGILLEHDQDGTHGAITTTSINNAGALTQTGAATITGALTLKSYDGYIYPTDTWTYASATTFTVSGDVTAQFPVGTKIKLVQTTTKYFYVTASSYSAPNTTVTITGGSDYSLANAAITSPALSYDSTPQGFPQWFNYTPTYSGITVGNGTVTAQFKMVANEVSFWFNLTLGSTSSVGTPATISTPVTVSSALPVGLMSSGTAVFIDNSTGSNNAIGICRMETTTTIRPVVGNASTTYTTQSGVTSTIPFTWATSDSLYMQGTYKAA